MTENKRKPEPLQEHQNERVKRSIESLTVSDVLQAKASNEIFALVHTCSIADGLKHFSEHNVLSMPVIHSAAVGVEAKLTPDTFLGMVDMLSLLGQVISGIEGQLDTETLSSYVAQQRARQTAPLALTFSATRIRPSGLNVDYVKGPATPLIETLQKRFLHPYITKRHIHRLVVFDEQDTACGLLSQSDVVRYFARHLDLLGDKADKTLSDLGVIGKDVLCVPSSTSALEAFQTIINHQVTAVGVLSGDKLVANLSASDVRGLMADNVASLAVPVEAYLQSKNRLKDPISCAVSDTLAQVLQLFTRHRVHRLYIVGSRGTPESVVTLTDVLRMICE